MNLTIKDRLIIPALLPKTGGLIQMITVQSITDSVRFTSEEITRFGLKDAPGATTWNVEMETPLSVEFTPEQVKVLKDGVKAVDESGQVMVDMLETIMKIQKL